MSKRSLSWKGPSIHITQAPFLQTVGKKSIEIALTSSAKADLRQRRTPWELRKEQTHISSFSKSPYPPSEQLGIELY